MAFFIRMIYFLRTAAKQYFFPIVSFQILLENSWKNITNIFQKAQISKIMKVYEPLSVQTELHSNTLKVLRDCS